MKNMYESADQFDSQEEHTPLLGKKKVELGNRLESETSPNERDVESGSDEVILLDEERQPESSKGRRNRRKVGESINISAWIYAPVDGWGSKASIDLKALKVACKQRGLTHGNRQSRDATIALLEEFDSSHSLEEIAAQRLAFSGGNGRGNAETETGSGKWTQNCWARFVHILTTQNVEMSEPEDVSRSLALKCPVAGEKKGYFTLSDLQLLFLQKDRLLKKEELDSKIKPNEMYWETFGHFFSEPNIICEHFDPTNEIVAGLDPNAAQLAHAPAKLEMKFKELKVQWERCYCVNFAASGNNENGRFFSLL
jgi:hypothetical protein